MNNIDLDYADYKTIKEHKGFCIGYNSEVVLIKNLDVELIQKFNKYTSTAKGILITFSINNKESISLFEYLMKKFNEDIHCNANIIFSTEVDNDLELGECKFDLLVTGLELI